MRMAVARGSAADERSARGIHADDAALRRRAGWVSPQLRAAERGPGLARILRVRDPTALPGLGRLDCHRHLRHAGRPSPLRGGSTPPMEPVGRTRIDAPRRPLAVWLPTQGSLNTGADGA